jgi:hypothetical protein
MENNLKYINNKDIIMIFELYYYLYYSEESINKNQKCSRVRYGFSYAYCG